MHARLNWQVTTTLPHYTIAKMQLALRLSYSVLELTLIFEYRTRLLDTWQARSEVANLRLTNRMQLFESWTAALSTHLYVQ